MDSNGIFDLDQAIKMFLKQKIDWCHNRKQARQFEMALRRERVKFKKTLTDPKYGGFEMVFTKLPKVKR